MLLLLTVVDSRVTLSLQHLLPFRVLLLLLLQMGGKASGPVY